MDELDNLSLEELKRLKDTLNKGDPLDSMSLDDLKKVHAAEIGNPTQKPAPKDTESLTEKFHSIRERIQTGVNDPLVGMVQNTAHMVAPDDVVKGVDALVKGREANYEKTLAPKGDSILDRVDGARLVGNAASSMATGGPFKSLPGAIANGMMDGYLQPNAADGSFAANKALDTGMGGAFGGALHAVTGLGKSLWNPDSANDLDLKRLLDSGVLPSIGQATGKNWMNSLEQKMTVIPWLGDAIRDMRDRGLNTWNKATMNEALKPSGYKVTEGGHEGIQQMKDAVEKAYDWAVGGVGNIPADAQHIIRTADIDNSINRLNSKADLITEPKRITEDVLGNLTGSNFKHYDATYRQLYEKLLGHEGPIESMYAAPIAKDLRMANRELLDRASPSSRSLLDDADKSFAGMKTVEKAMSNASNNGGIFTPKQLGTASRQAASDPSIIAAGDGLLQDWADIGTRYIGTHVPDSGTVGRALAVATDPVDSLKLAVAGNSHTGDLNDAIVALMANRPEWMKKVGKKAEDINLRKMIEELSGGLSQEYSPFGRR